MSNSMLVDFAIQSLLVHFVVFATNSSPIYHHGFEPMNEVRRNEIQLLEPYIADVQRNTEQWPQ